MRITLESDYALRIVSTLAAHGTVLDTKTISEETSVTLQNTSKILHKLLHKKLVESFKGVNGGYRLSGRPEDVTMKDVIEEIDGPISICRCLIEDEVCTRSQNKRECLFHQIFSEISASVSDKLGRITIADVIAEETDIPRLLARIRESSGGDRE